ncbi:MAG: 16S rRNA (cytosine(967)-C(5))-methyltransferase RsmB [Ruminococcaceae bacterium]|nr:16S rRNA (cytosine(967)-C(5))-methyltransferase RsmB [Oscillospiraceae bacterium]
MSTARELAVTALIQWERDSTFSNIMLDNLLRSSALSKADAAFATRLVYGTLERLLTLDWLLSKTCKQPLKKCHPTVRAVLRVGAYQLVFMKKIPASAAVNEAVKQVKTMKQAHTAGFVNGVLRGVDREHDRLLASLSTDLKSMSLRHSVPLELLQMWKNAYGADTAVALAKAANDAPPTVIRVNTLKTSVEALREELTKLSVAFDEVAGLPFALCIEDAAALRASSIPSDWYYFQDTASQWACEALDARAGERILDMCAAPGGKTFTTALRIGANGTFTACDVYDDKVRILRTRAQELGIPSLEAVCRDAASPCPDEWCEAFDRVICDVPCSGFGVIRRRPEIRYKALDTFAQLPDLQYRILCEAAKAVKSGGVLQYSTCTLRPEENEQVVARFLAEHSEFIPHDLPLAPLFEAAGLPVSHQLTMMPHLHGTDGFFAASFRKEES